MACLFALMSCAASSENASIVGCAISPQGKWVALYRVREDGSSMGGVTYSLVVFNSGMREYDVFEYLPKSLPNSGEFQIKFTKTDDLLVKLPTPESIDRQESQVDGLRIHYLMY